MSGPKTLARRILITGATGQLGFELQLQLQEEALVKPHEALDITKHAFVKKTVEMLRPAAVFNCAAVAQDWDAAERPLTARQVNGTAVSNLAQICFDLDIPFIHFGCPSVFGEPLEHSRPFTEKDTPAPDTPLGVSKLLGEYGILQQAEAARLKGKAARYWVFRLGAIFERPWRAYPNILQRILQAAECPQKRVPVLPEDQIVSPTAVSDVVAAMTWLLKNLDAVPPGIYHLANEGSCSLSRLAQHLLRYNNRGRGYSELLFKPARTLNSLEGVSGGYMQVFQALDCAKFLAFSPNCLRPWEDAVEMYMKDRRQA